LILFVAAGLLLKTETQVAIALGAIPMMLGLYIGNRIHLNISRETMLKIVGAILVASGASLIGKAIL